MKKLDFLFVSFCCIAATAALSGCGNVPGDDEVRQALKTRLISFGEMMSPGLKFTDKDSKKLDEALAKVKVIGCKKADQKNGFNCDWTGSESFAMVVGSSGRIVKSDSGWVLMKATE